MRLGKWSILGNGRPALEVAHEAAAEDTVVRLAPASFAAVQIIDSVGNVLLTYDAATRQVRVAAQDVTVVDNREAGGRGAME